MTVDADHEALLHLTHRPPTALAAGQPVRWAQLPHNLQQLNGGYERRAHNRPPGCATSGDDDAFWEGPCSVGQQRVEKRLIQEIHSKDSRIRHTQVAALWEERMRHSVRDSNASQYQLREGPTVQDSAVVWLVAAACHQRAPLSHAQEEAAAALVPLEPRLAT
ncbi:hypothetical protein Emed_007039 [Eimeria media]